MTIPTMQLDALDEKANAAFPGLVVRKDLLRVLRSAYGVPTFVIEFLLGKYAASPYVLSFRDELVRVGRPVERERLGDDRVELAGLEGPPSIGSTMRLIVPSGPTS